MLLQGAWRWAVLGHAHIVLGAFLMSAPSSVLHTIPCAPPAVPANLSPRAQDTQEGCDCPRWNPHVQVQPLWSSCKADRFLLVQHEVE